MASKTISASGIEYNTLLEHPPGSSSPGSKGYVLLVHAIMSNLRMWDSTVLALHSAGYSTLRVDHVGHGQSPVPPQVTENYTIDNICQHLHALSLQLLVQPPSAVIGCSIGGAVALRWGMLFGSERAKLVSIASPGAKSPDGFVELWAGRIDMFKEDLQNGGSDRLMKQTVERWISGDGELDLEAREQELVKVKKCSLEGYSMLAHAISNFDHSKELGKLPKGKCLIIACGKDASTSPARLRQMAVEIEGAGYELLEEACHLPSVHKLDARELNPILLRFLA